MAEHVTFVLNKMVRDGVLEEMLKSGQKPVFEIISGKKKLHECVRKVREEAAELVADDESLYAELVQLQSAVNALRESLGVPKQVFERDLNELEARRGSFDGGYFVQTIELSPADPWVSYYRQSPALFREISQ